MVKVQEGHRNQRTITIPIELAKALELDQGTELQFSVVDSETLELTKS